MSEYVSSVTQKGQVTIPAQIRRALKIKDKDMVSFAMVDGEVRLRPVKSAVLASFGAVKPRSTPEDFQQMRREFEEGVAEAALKEL